MRFKNRREGRQLFAFIYGKASELIKDICKGKTKEEFKELMAIKEFKSFYELHDFLFSDYIHDKKKWNEATFSATMVSNFLLSYKIQANELIKIFNNDKIKDFLKEIEIIKNKYNLKFLKQFK